MFVFAIEHCSSISKCKINLQKQADQSLKMMIFLLRYHYYSKVIHKNTCTYPMTYF